MTRIGTPVILAALALAAGCGDGGAPVADDAPGVDAPVVDAPVLDAPDRADGPGPADAPPGHDARPPADAPARDALAPADGPPLDAPPALDAPPPDAPPPDAGPPPDADLTNRGSLAFDGVDDRVRVPGILFFSLTALTVELWAKPATTGEEDYLLSKRGVGDPQAFAILRETGNAARVTVGNASSSCLAYGGSSAFQPGVWTHVALTWTASGGSPSLYVNGGYVSTSSCSTAMSSAVSDILFGATLEGSELRRFFQGSIDEVRIWGVARTQAQIDADRARVLTGDEPGLLAYWRFDEGTGGVAHATGADGIDGVLGSSAGADSADPVWSADAPF